MKDFLFIIVIDGSEYRSMYECMLADVADESDVIIISDHPQKHTLKKYLLDSRVRRFTKDFFDSIGYEKNNLYYVIEQNYSQYKNVVVLFFNAALHYNPYFPNTLIKYKKKWDNVRFVLYYLDIVNHGVSANANLLRGHGVFDLVYTIEEKDAKNIGAVLTNTVYSKNDSITIPNPQVDIYFCGVSKRRAKVIAELVENGMKNSVKMRMDVLASDGIEYLEKYPQAIYVRGINDYIKYQDVLINELGANCILEIVQPGQEALTLRPYEAVVYNKKLLTNNKKIFDFKYYNKLNMLYFECANDIDWEWVKDDNVEDYGYNGEFSMSKFIEQIKMDLNS